MLIWAPGKCFNLYSFFFPQAHSGMMESLAVPDRIESLPFHWLTNLLTAANPCPLPSSAYRDAPLSRAFSMESRSLFSENRSDNDSLNPIPVSITAILTIFFSMPWKWYFCIPTNPLLSLCSIIFWHRVQKIVIRKIFAKKRSPFHRKGSNSSSITIYR